MIEFECWGATIKTDGNLKYISLDRAKPSTDMSLGAHNECRLHIMSHKRGDDDESMIKQSWNDGAQQKGWMVYPDDIKAAEYTLITRMVGVLDDTDSISAKFGGAGHHTAPATNNQASCYEAHFEYSGSINKKNFSTEFNHGTYERYNVEPQNTYGPINNKWFGVKVVSMPRADNSARDVVTYFNEDPIDLATGKPKNTGWKKYTQWAQITYLGQKNVHNWGGAKDTWRIDKVTNMDIAYASRIEIEGISSIIH